MVFNRYSLLAVLAIGSLHTASASLILVSPTPFTGTGLGTVNTVLTMTSPGSSTTESGCVSFNGTADVLGSGGCFGTPTNVGGNEQTGASQTLTRTVAQSGATAGSDFRIVFNAAEPGGNSITLDSLAVRFFSPSGTPIFTASTTGVPITFASTFTGTGNSGFVFSLDGTQASAADAAGAFSNQSNRIGLSASASNATGGPETFFVTSATAAGGGGGGGAGGAVPEPATYALIGAGLVALALKRQRVTN